MVIGLIISKIRGFSLATKTTLFAVKVQSKSNGKILANQGTNIGTTAKQSKTMTVSYLGLSSQSKVDLGEHERIMMGFSSHPTHYFSFSFLPNTSSFW